ncbi:MAG: ATP-binding protein [Deltaproteobacteria bacterium]|nr:ATP-binding protein [Deltaproteobacteria bacterium]
MEAILSIKVESDLGNLGQIRGFIEKSAQHFGVPQDACNQIRLAVDEACANIVIHGYGEGKGDLEVSADRQDDAMVVTLRDRARPFNPTQHVGHPDFTSPLTERPVGGMGLFIIRESVDVMDYHCSDAGENILVLTKRFIGQS